MERSVCSCSLFSWHICTMARWTTLYRLLGRRACEYDSFAACRLSSEPAPVMSEEAQELPEQTAGWKEHNLGSDQQRQQQHKLRPPWRCASLRQSCQPWLLAFALCSRAAAGSILQRYPDEPFHWTAPTVVLAVVLFLVAGLCEIGGGWLVWQVFSWRDASPCPANHGLCALLCTGRAGISRVPTVGT